MYGFTALASKTAYQSVKTSGSSGRTCQKIQCSFDTFFADLAVLLQVIDDTRDELAIWIRRHISRDKCLVRGHVTERTERLSDARRELIDIDHRPAFDEVQVALVSACHDVV